MEHASLACPTGSFPVLTVLLKRHTLSLFIFLVSFGWGVRSGYSCSSYRSTTSFAFSSPLRVLSVLRPWSFHSYSNACPWNKLTFPTCPKPLLQSEARCKAIDMKMIFYFHANKTYFPRQVLQRDSFWKWEFLELGNDLLYQKHLMVLL